MMRICYIQGQKYTGTDMNKDSRHPKNFTNHIKTAPLLQASLRIKRRFNVTQMVNPEIYWAAFHFACWFGSSSSKGTMDSNRQNGNYQTFRREEGNRTTEMVMYFFFSCYRLTKYHQIWNFPCGQYIARTVINFDLLPCYNMKKRH